MEHTAIPAGQKLYKYHSGAPPSEDYVRALAELSERVDGLLKAIGADPLVLETVHITRPAPSSTAKRMIPHYSDALGDAAARIPSLVALDADLVLDTGLIPFRERFPARFFECGIAEQDMVSQAGGMALSGLLPIVHSFACFLTPRANEQIYNNATEGKKIIYVGALAGLLPAGPGHSHQAVRDISVMGSIPGMTVVEPSYPEQIAPLLDWAVVHANGPVYMRLCSIPWEYPYASGTQDERVPSIGEGHVLRDGDDVVIISHGPVMLTQAWVAADELAAKGLSTTVIGLPWLNRVSHEWLERVVRGKRLIVGLDDNYEVSGQADTIGSAMATLRKATQPAYLKLALRDVPVCGSNDEVLECHGLSGAQVAERIAAVL
jgi:transketolase